MRSIIRNLAICAALLGTALAVPPASAAGYPDHPVKIIVPFAAGGPTDVMARLLAQKLSDKLGQQFYIENLPGAGGNIGTANVGALGRRRLHDPGRVIELCGQSEPVQELSL